MASWRFYQGLRSEWRWYRLNESGEVIAESDQGFAELQGCMENAESAGFSGGAYQVYTRQPHELTGNHAAAPMSSAPVAAVTIDTGSAVQPHEPPEKAG
jgi:hypothetical protein